MGDLKQHLTFGHRGSGKQVIFHCDNFSDVFAVLKGKSKNEDIMHLIRVLHYAAVLHGLYIMKSDIFEE